MRILQLHKRQGVVFDAIQDKFAIDSENSNFCIADGASQGFLSEEWAKMLVDNFIENPTFDSGSLIDNFKTIAEDFTQKEFQLSESPAIRAVENRKKQEGSYATFLGVNLSKNILSYISSGDCCGFIIGSGNIKSFPFGSLGELDKDKGFIGTQRLIKGETEANQFRTGKITVSPNEQIILCTDAVARYIFTNPPDIPNILSLNDFETFKNWASEKIYGKLLEDDDLTIVSFSLDDIQNVETILPPEGFSFPKPQSIIIPPPPNDPKVMLEIQNKINSLESTVQKQNAELQRLNSDLRSLKEKILKALIITGLISLGLLMYGGYRLVKDKFADSEKVKGTEKVVSKDHQDEATEDESNITPDESVTPVKGKTSDKPKTETISKSEKKSSDKDEAKEVKNEVEKNLEKNNTREDYKKAEAEVTTEKSQVVKETSKD